MSLLIQTTRKLHLTDAGEIFFRKAEAAVAALVSAGEEASVFQKRPTGTLKITALADFDFTPICEAVTEYTKNSPR
ncbi:hypothetical protein [Neorhizobium lilium]|uniref:hypothetical protein n=1 Tax=Neorhizobium lilium TaxID=2503024 RepID=UPI001FE1AEE9|nr:hypothetical protein [Neorhizobium lilium]